MVIRCERCSTLYELDEGLLSPAGSQVQCTRCQHVFTAFPSRVPGRAVAGVEAHRMNGPAVPPAERPHAHPAGRRTAPGGAAASAEPARPVRSGPPPVYRPTAGAPPPAAVRAPILKRDTVGAFENRLRWIARWRWLAPLLVALFAGGAIAASIILARRPDPEVSHARGRAMKLLALDDTASVEQAIARLDAALRRMPKDREAVSDRALAYVLRAGALADEGESLATRLATLNAERERLRREQPPGWEDADRAAASDVQKVEPEMRAREERVRALGATAFQTLQKLQAEQGDGPEVARGLAACYTLDGDRERARRIIRAARDRAPADPWLDLVEAWVDARDPERAARERALVRLGTLTAAHPELLRARYLLARTDAALGRNAEAISALDGLLSVNARHEAAKRLRDELTAPPPPPPPEPPPPEVKPTRPRRVVTRVAPEPPAAAGATQPPAPDPGAPEPGGTERQAASPPRSTAAPAAASAAPDEVPAASEATAPVPRPVRKAPRPPKPVARPVAEPVAEPAAGPADEASGAPPPAAPAGAGTPDSAAQKAQPERDQAPAVRADGG